MSLTFKMWLPVIIVSVITIISMIIAKIVTDEDTWVFGVFFVGALLKCEDALLPGIKYSREKITSKKENGVIKGELAVKDGSCETADTDKNELNSDVPLGEITQ